jgi:hypothetical protein
MFCREAKWNFLENQIPVIQFVSFIAKYSVLLNCVNLKVYFCEPVDISSLDFLNVFCNVVTEYYFVSLREEMLIVTNTKDSTLSRVLGKWPTWRTNCINTTSGSCHSVSVAVSCAGWEFTPNLHTTQSDSYKRLYWYNLSLLMMNTRCSKHVESYE